MKRYLLKVTLGALVLGSAGFVRADSSPVAAPPAAADTNAAPAAAPAPTKDWSVTVGADLFSEYVFRGVDELGPKNPLFDPSLVLKIKNFGVYYYGYYGYDTHLHGTYTENDYAADYTQAIGNWSLTGGLYCYTYPNRNSGIDTEEVYAKVAYTCYVNPWMQINWDFDKFHTGFISIGGSHGYDVSKYLKLADGTLTITPAAELDIDGGDNSRKTQANLDWNDISFDVSASYNITAALSAHIGYQALVAMNALHDGKNGNQSIFNIGVAYAF